MVVIKKSSLKCCSVRRGNYGNQSFFKDYETFSDDYPLLMKSASKFTCNICKKSFNRKGHLIDHLNSHTGKRPYVCSYCARGFTTKANCNRHSVTCHLLSSPAIAKN